MAKYRPNVYSHSTQPQAILYRWLGHQSRQIALDSPAWFEWLQQGQTFTFTYDATRHSSLTLTIRPEKRGQRHYWSATKSIQGQTYKKYLAASAKLTQARLDAAAEWFLALLQAKREENEVMLLFAAVTDLHWLLQRFIEAHPYSPWRDRAEAELARIQEVIGL